MENRKYVVCRDNVYVGEVIATSRIYRLKGERDFFRKKTGQLMTGAYNSYRSMLFVPDENNLANDLLYKTPNYPVLNLTDDETCLNLGEKSIVINDACNLALLLQYFGYNEELTYEDIIKIRKTFFTGRFAKDHCELFGWKEITAEDLTFYSKGKVVTNPIALKLARMNFRFEQMAGHRSFSGISESPLPREYYDILDDRGNNTLADILAGWATKTDTFAPHKNEGPIRKLTRF